MMEYLNPNEHWMNNAMKDLEPDEAHAVGCVTAAAYVCMFLFGLLLCALLGSCKSQKNLIHEKEQKDSVRVDVRYQTIIVPDTVFVEIPPQIAERTTADSTSHLENDYATSDARINPDGTMFHQLATKPQKKPVQVDKEIERRDSVAYVDRHVEVPIPVERSLTYLEKTCIKWFPWCLILLIIAIGYIFRKPILKITKRLL